MVEFTWAAAMAPLSTMACLWAWVLERATHRQLRPGLKQHYGLPIEPWPTQRPVPSALRRRSPEESAQKARPVSCGATKTALSGAVRRCQALSGAFKPLAGLECAQLGKGHCVDAVDRAAVAGLVKVRVIIQM